MTTTNGHDGPVSVDPRRVPFDSIADVARIRTNACFVCRIVTDCEGEHVVYRDRHHIAFLPRFHVQRGYVLVAPIAHREALVDDLTTDEYLGLQRVVRRVAQAVAGVVPTERIW